MWLFPVNILHNLIHLIFAIWGFVAFRSHAAAVTCARSVAIIYAIFALMGLIPVLKTTFGLVPLCGYDLLLHVVLAAPAAYSGFIRND